MKKWIGILLSVAMLLSVAACGKNETGQPKDDSALQPSGSASNEETAQPSDSASKDEDARQPDSDSEEEKEPAKAVLKYTIQVIMHLRILMTDL